MSRTLTPGMEAHLAGNTHTLASMLRLDLVDGSSLCFTNHDQVLNFDLGDGAADYQPGSGIDVSDIVLTVGLEASNYECKGPISETVTRTQVLGGRFRKAAARMFMVNWAALDDGPVRIMKGRIGEGRVQGSQFVLEVRGLAGSFNESWGRVLNPLCTATFGNLSTGCPVVRTAYPATVTAVEDDFNFTVDLGGDHPDDFFNLGGVQFLTGPLTDTAEGTIIDYDGTTGAVELLEPLVDSPEVGDTLNLFRGCSKLLKSDDASLPTCLTYDAVLSFRGWPEVPGSRTYHKVSAPGASYA